MFNKNDINPHKLLGPIAAFVAFRLSQQIMQESSLPAFQANFISGVIALATLTLISKAIRPSDEELALREALVKAKEIAVTQRTGELHEAAFSKNLAFLHAVLLYSMSIGWRGFALFSVIDGSISALMNNATNLSLHVSLPLTAASLFLIEKNTASEEFKHHKKTREKDLAVSVAQTEVYYLNPIKKGVASLLSQVGFKDIHQKVQPKMLENASQVEYKQ